MLEIEVDAFMYRDSVWFPFLSFVRRRKPDAVAVLAGSLAYPGIRGEVLFWETPGGVLVVTEVGGLPTMDARCEAPIFAFHIHDGDSCEDASDAPFPMSGTHYNPWGCPHPYHAGDLPPLFGVQGNAFSAFLSGRFSVREVLGMTVIIHAQPDDFTTQPSGNPGEKIACGMIRAGRG